MRLIDADKLKRLYPQTPQPMPSIVMGSEIDNAPTVDAEPVRHGHYIGEADGYADGELVYDIWSCSECGCYFEDWDEKPTYNFCPNCGAKMDGERKEAPTVEAIPIEWIRNYIIKVDDVWHYDETQEVLEEMLKEWEKENEAI